MSVKRRFASLTWKRFCISLGDASAGVHEMISDSSFKFFCLSAHARCADGGFGL